MTEALLPIAVTRRRDGSHALSRVASVAVLTLALSVLVGWWLEHPGLRSGVVGLIAMNPVSAIAFILASVALRLLLSESPPPRSRLLARLCAAVVVLLALLCLSRLFIAWDLGPDRLLFRDQLARADEGRPNRMAPNTALNFVLLGMALLCLDYRTRRGWRPAEGLALTAGVFGLVAVAGYVYGSSVLYGVGTFIPMAANTAIGFLILSTGVICARPGQGLPALFLSRSAGALLARRLLPAALIVPLAFGWLRLEGQKLGLYDTTGGVSFMVTATTLILAVLVWRCAVELDRSDLARGGAEQSLRLLNEHLEARVAERTEDLERLNEELRMEVDERGRAEDALREQTSFLRHVIDANPQLIFVKDWDGRFTLANQAVASIYGTTVDSLVGKTDAAFNPNPGEVQSYVQADREVMSSARVRVIQEEPVTGPDGEVRWFHTVKAPLFGPDGTCRKVMGVATDITARRRAEGELRQATDELRALFDASPLAISSYNGDGQVRSWNRAAEKLFGWTADEVIGRSLSNVPADLMVEYQTLRDRVLAGNPLTNYETRRLCKDGRELDVSISTASLRDSAGANCGVVAVYMDVSGRKALESQLRQAQKMEAVGRLAGGVAHDFNNMLTVIRSSAEFLLADLDAADPRRAEAVEIRDTADRAGSLTRQLLAFSRQQVLQPRVVNLNGVVTELQPMVRRVVEENITVRTRLSPDLDRVRADRSQLDQVILNLVVNAREERRPDREDRTAGASILVVEDDVAVRTSVRRLLERHGYHVLEAPSGEQALTALAESTHAIDLVVSDMVMPEMSGLELRQRLRATRPALPVLLMSGYSEEAITRLGSRGSLEPLIEKPFTVQGLLDKVRDALTKEGSDA